jgi:predicted molibdopterin-dependent oxidoreductase YjgC
MTNTIEELAGAGAILVIGSNTTENHPVIGYRVREAVRNGAKLIVAEPRHIPLVNIADVHLRLKPGTDVALCNALVHVIIKEGLEDKEYIRERTQGFEYLQEMVEKYTPEYVAEITGVPAEDIIKAARLFAEAESGAIIYCMGITQHTSGTENVVALTNISLLTGNLGVPNAGMNPLRGQNNVQGACDMGCLPNVFTGYQPVYGDREDDTYWQRLKIEKFALQPELKSNIIPCKEKEINTSEVIADTIEFEQPVYKGMSVSAQVRAKFSKAWGVELSDIPGRTISDMFHDNPSRRNRVLYLMGENLVVSDPNSTHLRECLEDLDFFVVQDIFLTETARYADVVLPAASFAEKEGTFINTERRVQRVRPAIKPRGDSKPDWEIIQLLAQRLGLNWNYSTTEEIWDEVRELTPHYFKGMSYERLEECGLQWPCPSNDHPGTPIIHKGKFARGIGQFSTVEYRPLAAEAADTDYPFILTTGRKIYHYHTRTMTGKTDGLNALLSEELIDINPMDAQALDLNDHDMVRVTSRRGSIKTKIQITNSVTPGLVCMSFHFAKTAVNVLTGNAVCNVSVIPGVKVSAVRLEKA